MTYSRPPFPRPLYARFRSLAAALGWGVRGQCWKFLDLLLAYAMRHPDLFKNRASAVEIDEKTFRELERMVEGNWITADGEPVNPMHSPNPRPHERPV